MGRPHGAVNLAACNRRPGRDVVENEIRAILEEKPRLEICQTGADLHLDKTIGDANLENRKPVFRRDARGDHVIGRRENRRVAVQVAKTIPVGDEGNPRDQNNR